MRKRMRLLKKLLQSPTAQRRYHRIMATMWVLLIIPTLLWWKDSVLWVALMSLWANIASHWSGAQAAGAEKEASD